jgi:hypothetical protein
MHSRVDKALEKGAKKIVLALCHEWRWVNIFIDIGMGSASGVKVIRGKQTLSEIQSTAESTTGGTLESVRLNISLPLTMPYAFVATDDAGRLRSMLGGLSSYARNVEGYHSHGPVDSMTIPPH